ncbi:hypothetical protein, partial [Cupriavidus sp. CuC1]|uniref:hypothetical protein n=1 Tax=Cupriavidus sp. CuC1 TaxID=3373131 RepID=UPI0037D489B6
KSPHVSRPCVDQSRPSLRCLTWVDWVFASHDLLLREIELLDGVLAGFIEISNYRGSVREILSPAIGRYVLIDGRDDSTRRFVEKDELNASVWGFLTR